MNCYFCILTIYFDLCSQVLKLLSSNATSTPQSLGDARKESPEELQSRHECVLAATCAVLGKLVKNSKELIAGTSSSYNAQLHAQILDGCKSLLKNATFLKTTLQSKSPLVRRSAYNLIASICQTAPEMVASDDDTLELFSPLVLGCLGEKESSNHSSMWDMILSFASITSTTTTHSTTTSTNWCDHVNLSKAIFPKFWSLLRNGCYGSAETSYPAVLPFINLLVQNTTSSTFGYNAFESLLSAVWDGVLSLVVGSAAQEAAATCFSECYLYATVKVEELVGQGASGEDSESAATTFCEDLFTSVIEKKCLGCAVGGPFSSVSRSVLLRIITKLAEHALHTPTSRWKEVIFISTTGAAIAESTALALENLNAAGAPSVSAIEELLLGIKSAVGDDTIGNAIAMAAARPVVAALIPSIRSTENAAASTAAAAFLASLVKSMPDLNSEPSEEQIRDEISVLQIHDSLYFSADSIFDRITQERQTGPALQASCDLIVSCLLRIDGPGAAEKLTGYLQNMIEFRLAEAANMLLSRYINNASDEKLAATRSPELTTYFMEALEALQVEYVEMLIMLIVGNGRTPLIDEKTQDEGFESMAAAIETKFNVDETPDGSEMECALRIIKSTVFSPALDRYTDVMAICSRLRALTASFGALVDEAIKEALLVVEMNDSEYGYSSDSEDNSAVGVQHSTLYNLTFDIWSQQEKICPLLRKGASGGIPFCETLAQAIYATLTGIDIAYEHSDVVIRAACKTLAMCSKIVLDGIAQNTEILTKTFLHLIAKKLTPFSYYHTLFFDIGEIIGWPRLLKSLGDGSSVEGEEDKNSELIGQILANIASPPVGLVSGLLKRPTLLARVLKKLSANRFKYSSSPGAFSQLLCAVLSSSKDEQVLAIATSVFREYLETKTANIQGKDPTRTLLTLIPVLDTVPAILRSSEKLLSSSGLPELAQRLCRFATTSNNADEKREFKLAAAACFPVPLVAPPVPKWAPSPPAVDAPSSFAVGDLVWYRHKDDSWEASEVDSIDISVDPPSFAVKLATGVRETERGRLVARAETDESPPGSGGSSGDGGGEGIGYTFSSNITASKIVPVCCLEKEKLALLELFRSICFGNTTEEQLASSSSRTASPDKSSAAILCSALAWCFSEFTQADWEAALTTLQLETEAVASSAATAAVSAASVVVKEAEIVAGMAVGDAEASLAFFRQLHRTGFFEDSDKGAGAAARIQQGFQSKIAGFESSGAMLDSLLQSYCTASKLIATTARTCPFIAWEAAQAGVCAAVLDIFISLGKIVALAEGCGRSYIVGAIIGNTNTHPYWDQLAQVVDATVAAADRAFLAVVVERVGARQSEDGVGCTEALVSLALNDNIPKTARNAAYRSILLHSELVLDLVRSTGADDDDPLLDTNTDNDWYADLVAGGLLPEVASVASNSANPCFVTAWGLITAFLLHSRDSSPARTKLVESIKEVHILVHSVLDDIVHFLPLSSGTGSSIGGTSGGTNNSNTPSMGGAHLKNGITIFGAEDTSGDGFSNHLCALGVPIWDDSDVSEITTADRTTCSAHAALLYAGMLRALPVLCRLWYGDLRDRSMVLDLEKYTSVAVSAGLLSAEYAAVDELVKGLDRFEKFSVKANSASREVVASMEVEDGHMIELVIKLPATMPLKAPEAECRRSVGVSEARLRKWLLSITAFLRNRNGAIADALRLWKRNVDTEFEGHDDCLICYSIIQPSTGQLPRLACRCCRKKYHGTCLYKWFHSSGKSNCPHCQSPW